MKLPDYHQAKENIELGVSTPLERFIYDFEPLDNRDAKLWREMLNEAVGYVVEHYVDCQKEEMPVDCEGQLEIPILDTEQE